MEGDCIMTQTAIAAIIKYIDTKIEYELASIEEAEEGYRGSCIEERRSMEAAKAKLLAVADDDCAGTGIVLRGD
jgi:hypothetical protein